MKTAIILHGMPSRNEYLNGERSSQSNSHWLPWLQQQLIVRGILAQTPELPEPYLPVYGAWSRVFEQFEINEDTILVGHSCGAGFLLRWLSENKINVGTVALVAPWLNLEKSLQNDFFSFNFDKELFLRVKDVKIFISRDDDQVIIDSVKLINEKFSQVKIQWFEDRGHFTLGDMKTEKFPELLDFLLE
jgi:predicted alpha/beta hydrolase family esterase